MAGLYPRRRRSLSRMSPDCGARPGRDGERGVSLEPAGWNSLLTQVATVRAADAPLSEVKDDPSRYLREAEKREVVITGHGKPAGVLIGFASEDDWFDYRLENDPRFLVRVAPGRSSAIRLTGRSSTI